MKMSFIEFNAITILFFSSRSRHTRFDCDWSSDVCSSDLAHPAVNRAAEQAIAAGVVGPLPPPVEEELAEALCHHIPWIEAVRFLKTGAEAVAAAVRLARVATGRDPAPGGGYHGGLGGCQGGGIQGVPAATRALYAELPFNDAERTRQQIREAGDRLAVVVIGRSGERRVGE